MAGLEQYSPFFANPLFTNVIKEVPIKKGYIAHRFLPREETYETKFHESQVVRQADMANIVSGLAEVPLTDRDPMKAVSGEISDISQGYVVTKEELGALMDKGNPQRRKIAETQLLGKAKTIKENIDARIEWMGWQAMGNGRLIYEKDGIYLTTDFGLDPAQFKTAATRWDAITGTTIITDYEKWNQDYLDRAGEGADTFVTSIQVIRTVLNDPAVRKAVSGASEKLLELTELNKFLIGRQMAPMEAFDASVTYRDVKTGGKRVSQRLLAANKGVFLKEGKAIGEQLLGPTIENEMNPGIFAHTIHAELPRRDIIQVVASSFPKVLGPQFIQPCTVLT
ncbi:major capsid protein [Paenibacillus agilis]|uniref:Major capsid protein n=1 Tax=Paenibacillus agilis TaxID=3020863 RepID=A0A559IX91_9BACL|nr:major capsid protein [Paenibacillus agilis]TVX92216.1 major capsid protein [Paenibacillus agilis]